MSSPVREKNPTIHYQQPTPAELQFVSVKSSSPNFSKVEEVFRSRIEPLYGNQDEALRKIKNRTDRKCEGLLHNDNLVGFIVYKKENQQEFYRQRLIDVFELKTLVVMEFNEESLEVYGTLLVNRVIKLAKRNFSKNVCVTVSDTSQEMLEFFRGKGFGIVQTWKDKYTPGAKEFLLSLNVPEKSNKVMENIPKIEEREVVKKRERSHSRERDLDPQREKEKLYDHPMKKRETEADYRRTQDQRNYDYRGYDSFYGGKGSSAYSRERHSFSVEGSRANSSYASKKSHEITLKRQYIHQIKYSGKTIEGRINSGMILRFKTGDQIRFFYNQNPSDDVKCDIIAIRNYPSFREMLEQEGFKKCLTNVKSLEDAVRVYDQIPGYAERAARCGVVAIQLNVIR